MPHAVDYTLALTSSRTGTITTSHRDEPYQVSGSDPQDVRQQMLTWVADRAQRADRTFHIAAVDEDGTTINLDVDPQGHVRESARRQLDDNTWIDSHASRPNPNDSAPAAATSARAAQRPTVSGRAPFVRRVAAAVAAWFTSLGPGARLGLIALAGVIAVTLIASAIVTRSPAPATGPPNGADGCIGGTDLERAVDQAAGLATTSTIEQDGVTVPSPNGAAAAAAAFARLRSTLPPPDNRDELIDSILASNATPLAQQAIPAEPGWTTQLDMTQGRWQVTSGNGQRAALDLLLTTEATQDGQPVAPAQFTVAMNLVVEDGQWRLHDIGAAQTPPEVLATANPYINGDECS